MKKVVLFIFFTFFKINNSLGQSNFVSGLFPTIDHSGSISKRIDYGFYYFGSFPFIKLNPTDFPQSSNFLLFYAEQGLTFNFNKHWSFASAYVYQRENVTEKNFVNEHRVHLQTTFKHSLKNVNIKHRLRLDNRFIHNNSTGETPYTHRLRYLIGIDIPIKNNKNNLYFTAYQEAFFNTFKNASAVFGENWAYAALGVILNSKNKIETGPLYITWNTGGNNWFHQYYLQITWISHLDFTKPKPTE